MPPLMFKQFYIEYACIVTENDNVDRSVGGRSENISDDGALVPIRVTLHEYCTGELARVIDANIDLIPAINRDEWRCSPSKRTNTTFQIESKFSAQHEAS